MRRTLFTTLLLVSSLRTFAAVTKFDPLPAPVANNAVAQYESHGEWLFYSFMGIGAKKTWDAISSASYVLDTSTGKWSEIRPVPGTAGRIAASAVTVKDRIFLLGGYFVDAQGKETTSSSMDVFEPRTGRWLRGDDIPVPVDDFVAGVYRDRYIYLIAGWSKDDAVSKVQVYDTEKQRWFEATGLQGTPVFGHAGGIVDDIIVYVDGAHKNLAGPNPKYIASDECWYGKIDHRDPAKITWARLPEHQGNARYRIAAGASRKDQMIYFSGGTDNPYNYNGVGYDGQPSEPSPLSFAYNLRTNRWQAVDEETPNPTMDHRGLLVTQHALVTLGGMEKGQKVSDRIKIIAKPSKD
jgi:hypothetical protein